MTPAPLSAAILVGGRSRRMGETKALLRLDPDGPTVVESVVRALGEVASEILLAGSPPTGDFAFLGLRQVPDIVPNAGVLGGMHAALREARHDRVLVVACDMPFLSPALLRYMASLPAGDDALVPLLGQPQTAHAIYARSALPAVEAALTERRYHATSWFAQASIRIVPRETIAAFDPLLRSCFNMNTPQDLEAAREMAFLGGGEAPDQETV